MVHIVWLQRNGRTYGYLARSFRIGSRVMKRKVYYGFFSGDGRETERLSLKDLVWLLKGREGIEWLNPEEIRKWFMMSGFHRVQPLCDIYKAEDTLLNEKEVKTIILNIINKIGLAPCAACYIIKHGIPTHFKELFDQYGLTDIIIDYANDIAEAYSQPDFVLIEPNEYFLGKPEDYERVKEFLTETRDEQLRKK